MKLLVVLGVLTYLGCSVPLAAQIPEEPDVQTYRLSALSWQKTIRNIFFKNDDGEEFELFIPNGSPSKEFEFTGAGPLVFYRKTGVNDLGEPIETPIAVYRPQTTEPKLLLFVPDGSVQTERFRLLPVDYDPKTIPEGSYRFLNLAQAAIFVKFGKDTFMVKPRDVFTQSSDAAVSDGLDVAIAMQQSAAPDDIKLVYSSAWTLKAGRSAFVFVTNEPGVPGNIEVKRVYF